MQDRGTGGVRFQWAESDAPVTVKLDGDVNFPEYVPVPRTEMAYGGLRPGLWRFTMYDEVRCASVYVVEIPRTSTSALQSLFFAFTSKRSFSRDFELIFFFIPFITVI